MEGKSTSLLGFIIGLIIAGNWPKIKKLLDPYLKDMERGSAGVCNAMTKFFLEQKEYLEDVMASFAVKAKSPEKIIKEEVKVIKPKTREGQILSVLKNNPGKSLTEIGSILGVQFIGLVTPIKRLIEQGKIYKKGKVYFPVI